MFDRVAQDDGGGAVALADLRRALTAVSGEGLDDRAVLDHIRALEELKAVAAAAQARLTAAFATSRRAQLARTAPRMAAERVSRDIGAQIGLARRVSPRVGARLVGLAAVLGTEMPQTRAALEAGRIDEYQALLLVAETATLTREHRGAVDAELAGRLGTMTAREARGAAARMGYRLDPAQAVARVRKAESDRRVTLRPAPDTMTYLTALLPAAQGVAVHAALTRHADVTRAAGDLRGTGALVADEFVARALRPAALHTSAADDATADRIGVPPAVGVEIQLVMTDRTLLDGDAEPALLTGYGPIPAPLARRLVTGAARTTTMWVRRLYAEPESGELIGGDVRRRLFGHAERQFLVARDQTCRTPWCDAPIRHADHVQPHARGGPTVVDNGAGLCADCNQVKESPGWVASADLDGSITLTTPTGHRYRSTSPPAPWSPPWWDEPDPRPLRSDRRAVALRRLANLRPRAA